MFSSSSIASGDGRNHIITLVEVLTLPPTQGEYLAHFFNTDMNGENYQRVGYDSATTATPLPPGLQDGSLRFTGMPYYLPGQQPANTQITMPSIWGGAIMIKHSETMLITHEPEACGDVVWGQPYGINNQTIIGKWKVV